MRTTEAGRIFCIGDLHLPGGFDKPMRVFGEHWDGHFDKISADWRRRVGEEDIVLIPGDISWAMQLHQAVEDLEAVAALPGSKVMIRGNHDYWWSAISKLRAVLPEGMHALQNDALLLGGRVFCGSRGWVLPAGPEDEENQKIYDRELLRMELSLQQGRRLSQEARLIVLTHYPPTEEDGRSTRLTQLLGRYGASDVVYGHLHGRANEHAFAGAVDGVRCHPCSCDGLGFRLYELPEAPVGETPTQG